MFQTFTSTGSFGLIKSGVYNPLSLSQIVALTGGASVTAINISADGSSIVYVTNGYNVYLSVDFGASFTLKSNITSVFNTTTFRDTIVVSNGGQHMFLYKQFTGNNSQPNCLIMSHDYGVNWTNVTSGMVTGVPSGGSAATGLKFRFYSVSISCTGQYVLASGDNGGSGLNPGIYVSSDYGYNWIYKYFSNACQGSDISAGDGRVQACAMNDTSTIMVSQNYGFTWNAVAYPTTARYGRRVVISEDGNFGLVCSAAPSAPSTAVNWSVSDISGNLFTTMSPTSATVNTTLSTDVTNGLDKQETFALGVTGGPIYYVKNTGGLLYQSPEITSPYLQTQATYTSLLSAVNINNGRVYGSSNTKYLMVMSSSVNVYLLTNEDIIV